MYHVTVGISEKEYDAFAIASSQTNLLHSSKWAQVKSNWQNERLGFYKDDQLVAVASILIKSLPLGFTMLYIPRGPIMDYSNKELVNFVLKTLTLDERNVLFLQNSIQHFFYVNITLKKRMSPKR